MPKEKPKETHQRETPSFYAIIPADVRYSQAVCMGSKLLYGEITALCNKEGFCWASNTYFSELYERDTNTISRWIKELTEAGFIYSEINQKEGNQRRLYLSSKMPIPTPENVKTPTPIFGVTPIHKNGVYNNTDSNNTSYSNTTKGKTPPESIEDRKKKFFSLVDQHRKTQKGKLPDVLYQNFFDYWTELNELKGGKKMRFEEVTFFEIGRRISTFWKRVTDEERGKMWKLQGGEKKPLPQAEINFDNLLKTNSEEWK